MTHLVRYQDEAGGTGAGVLRDDGQVVPLAGSMAQLLALPLEELRAQVGKAGTDAVGPARLLAPLDGRGEVWCAGVTYARSRSARMEESTEQSVYDRVYSADRPELFLKSPAWRVVTDGEPVGIRVDSGHDVPEPELAVVANRYGEIVGFTVCNDMSSRSIEGENPLYIPQAKIFAGGCALAPGIRPAWEVGDPAALTITLSVRRGGGEAFSGKTSTNQLIRGLDALVGDLFTGNEFPDGAVLATGTGIVPDLDFALQAGDEIRIEVEQVGVLTNTVAVGKDPFGFLSGRADVKETR
ncbi:MAG TPA: fumarylacetoacetate hydrolase family protein [Kribbellaceae bacterium]|nr:fumarylacetoacetate hydrolase family protein [Kribbellaceae bacterium]